MKQFFLCLLFLSRLLYADFDMLDSHAVPTSSLDFKPSWSPYYEPNESKPASFGIEHLRREEAKGLLVSVGMFRTLIIYAWATHITHLLMADIDQRIVDFNKKHLRFIQCIAEQHPDNFRVQRAHYLAAAHRLSLSDDELTALARTPKLTAKHVQKMGAANLINDTITDPCLLAAIRVSKVFDDMTLNNIFETMFKYERIKGERYYWDDDEQWKKIVEGVLHKKIAATRLSISPLLAVSSEQNEDVKVLFDFITKSELDFGILDVSNTPTFRKNVGNNSLWATFLRSQLLHPKLVLVTEQKYLLFHYRRFFFHEFLHYLAPAGDM